MRADRLRTEYLDRPLGLGTRTPRFSWICDGGISQTAYRIVAFRDGEEVWDTGRVESSQMTHVRYDGQTLGSRDRVEWTVTLWDETGVAGQPASSWFELGLLSEDDWTATWISGDYEPKKNKRYPVDCFRKRFETSTGIKRARLYITACGLYDAWLNGMRIGDAQLTPGSTDYRKRLQYQTYDVTDMLRSENIFDVRLADGWYRGSVGCFGQTNVFGRQTKLLCQLEITYRDGQREVIESDRSFSWSNDGTLVFADLQDGEIYDARREPSYREYARVASDGPIPTASDNVVPKKHEELTPVLLITPSGRRVLDFGQNIAGFVSLKVSGAAGKKIDIWLGETLDDAGEFTQANMQAKKPVKEYGRLAEIMLMTGNEAKIRGELQPTPRQQIKIICREGETSYETSFAVFGFRYALVETDIEIDPTDFRAVAVYSDMEQVGTFECSSPEVNQLLANTLWSMKGNFLDVPTDCPTRERLGWTGDAQIFFETAAYLMDVATFYRKWLRDLEDNQMKSGKVSAVVPYNGLAMMYDSTGESVGWADATVLVPYRLWKRYGDADAIREFYPMMRRYAMFVIGRTGHKDSKAAKANPFNKYVYEKGMHLGEWLEPEEFRDDVRGRILRTEEATAYLHYTMKHLAEIARAVDAEDDATLFSEYSDGAKRAYEYLFLTDGGPDTDRQAKLVRPLALGLADGDARSQMERRLVKAVENRDYRIGTGFLSTPFVLPVLSAAGRNDVAYRMLENDQAPSWLAEVAAGATTVWEDWEGKESLNHYSPGAVCQWLFDTVAGIRVVGERQFEITPTPGGSLTFACAQYMSPYGLVKSSWSVQSSGSRFEVSIPPNTSAKVRLPNGEVHDLGAGTHDFIQPE